MDTILLLVIIVLLFVEVRDRRLREEKALTPLRWDGQAEQRLRRLTDQAVLDMLDEVRRSRGDTGLGDLP